MDTSGRSFTPFSTLTLLLTGRCNLACSYCYQDKDHVGGTLPWDAARAALDLLFAHGTPPLTLEFSGGEPLLETHLLKRCVEYVEKRSPIGKASVQCILTTNGTLLTPRRQDFLAEHGFVLQLSFDGVPPVQKFRGRGSFRRVEQHLEELCTNHPVYARSRVRVQAVLTRAGLPYLAESARYFMDKDVAGIVFQPAIGSNGGWSARDQAVLQEQMERIVELGTRYWTEHQKVPLALLHGLLPANTSGPGDGFLCGAGVGKGLCVDSTGRGWTCPLFAATLHELPLLARAVSRAVDVGDVRSPDAWKRLAATRLRTGRFGLLTKHEERYSTYGPCRNCEFEDECFVCPAAVSHAPDDMDPDRIPDFHCAFNRAAALARRKFRREALQRSAH